MLPLNSNMKQKQQTQNKLEKILSSVKSAGNSIKAAGRTALKETAKFCRDNYRVLALATAWAVGGAGGAYVLDKMMVGEAKAGGVKMTNSSVALGDTYMYNTHISGANENDDGFDSPYLDGPAQLDIYSNNPVCDCNLTTDSRPLNSITPFEIKLKANKFITYADNSLKFKVFNSDGTLNHRFVIAYDTSKDINDVNNIHEIPKDGNTYMITLPDVDNQPAGIYANWRVEMPRIVEGDLNENGKCNFLDYAILAKEWKQTSSSTTNGGNYLVSDLNLDRVTDEKDLAIFLSSWLESE